jgi:hypothetical protein
MINAVKYGAISLQWTQMGLQNIKSTGSSESSTSFSQFIASTSSRLVIRNMRDSRCLRGAEKIKKLLFCD